MAQKKIAPAEARQAETNFLALVNAVEDYAIFMLDPKGFVLTWNRGAQRLKGYKPEEIIGRHFSSFYTKEDIVAGKPALEMEVAIAEGRCEDEGWRIRKDGSRFWALATLTAIRGADGKLEGFAEVTRDMSERRTAEEILRRSEERLRLMIESVQDYAIFTLEPDGRVASWNIGAQRLKQYLPEEIIGQSFRRFYPPEDLAVRKPDKMLEIAAHEGRCLDEGWRLRKDGSRFWASVVITALRDRDGKLVGFTKVTRDLTERKLAEELLEKGKNDLEKRVEQRTAELIEMNKELQQFAYVASHDLQEPLRKIITFAERLREYGENRSDREKEYLTKITNSSVRMKTVIEDLLSYSHLQNKDVQFERSDMGRIIRDVVSDLELKVAQSHAEITIEPLPKADVNPSLIRHVFQNLILNSIKFSKKGVNPRVEVTGADDGRTVTIWVRDHGIGFDEKYSDRIFRPFQRLHNKNEYEGSGIGLAICQKIVQQHGGEISAAGIVGEGATFTVRLPKKF